MDVTHRYSLEGKDTTVGSMATFVPGRDLARTFYHEVLRDIVGAIPHAAGLLGEGSDVLGFDTARSTDHAWGPRAQIFVDAAAVPGLRMRLDAELPSVFRGWPVRFYRWQSDRVDHHIEVTTVGEWLQTTLGRDPRSAMPLSAWLSTPRQLLLEVTGGLVFHDDAGELSLVRTLLAWYPHDVWLWVMAAQWSRLANAESFIGRTAELGDDLGARLIAGRIAQDAVHLCFLQERRYAPYEKWLGTAFAQLTAATEVGPAVHDLLTAADVARCKRAAVHLYGALARRHNALGVTLPLPAATGPYEVKVNKALRPYAVLNAGRFAQACAEAIADAALRRLPLVGSVDQLTDPTDLLVHFTDWPRRLSTLYQHDLDREAGPSQPA